MPVAPPTNFQLMMKVSMMMVMAMVAMEKKMPRMRNVSSPMAHPSAAPARAAAMICTSSGAPSALNRKTAV